MHSLTLIIGNKNYSSWSLRPWILLKTFEIPFKEILIPLKQSDSKQKVLQYSPAGKVPVLLDGSTRVWESLAIAEYVAELFPQKMLWPSDAQARAQARSVSGEMYSGFSGLRQNFPLNVSQRITKASTPDADKDIRRVLEIWETCRTQFEKQGPFLFGPFCIADAMYAPVVFRFQTYGMKMSPLAEKYYQAMLALPAMKEWQNAAKTEEYPWS